MKNNLTLSRQVIGGSFLPPRLEYSGKSRRKLWNESIYFFGKTWYNIYRKLRVPINGVLTKIHKIGKSFRMEASSHNLPFLVNLSKKCSSHFIPFMVKFSTKRSSHNLPYMEKFSNPSSPRIW